MTPSSAYTITEALSDGRAIVHRAIRSADDRSVILKVLDPGRSRPRDVERLRHEYEIGASLTTPAAVKPLALDRHEGMPALVLEDFGGLPLDRLLGAPMPLERFLPLAVRIAGAVAEVHREGVVHKDLKPQNILVHPATGEVKITDFELASRLPREEQPPQPPRLIEGSLPYLAPEQTGRIHRAIDDRTDLYSLGVTFHQMLTAKLPFEARDPAEWVHCHVARAAPSAAEAVPELPEPVARIVLKLLSKMPEDRYQSARGLRLDWERCLAEWSARGRIEPFALGTQDVAARLRIPQKLYGREAEIDLLLAAFDRVAGTGTPELLLVSGYSGIGKSALVQELYRPIVREHGSFIAGKFDQYKRDIPYSTLVQAFRDLVLEILAESEERLAAARQRLLGALGINAHLIIDVIPQVELVVGPQPPASDLPPTEAQNRFRMVFRRFIAVLAREDHPLALFLDDLQWADSASLALLHDLMTHPETRHLLVIGAYRDNEVAPSHPLALMLDQARKGGTRVSDIVLGPLSREHLGALLGEALHCGREDAAPLADLIHDKTAGNPFFAIQFLLSLHEERLVELDEGAGVFRWDVAKIREKGFTDNVVELMAVKLRQLPEATQETLRQLACLGNTAETAFLAIACGRSEEVLHTDLWGARHAGLVLRLGSTYKFLHDRVQEAAYSLVPEDRRAEMHLEIGRLLVGCLSDGAIAERVFDVVSHWNRGAPLITDPQERETLHRLNVLAGTKAKAAVAYASARGYLERAMALLPPDAWKSRYEDTFALHLTLSECECLVGNFQRADELLSTILDNARSPLDEARAYGVRMKLCQIAGRYDHSVTTMFEAVRSFGMTFPESAQDLRAATEAEVLAIRVHLRGRRIADVADAPMITDPNVRAIITLLVESMPAAYTARPHHFPLIVARAVNLSLLHGNSAESCHAYSAHAITLVSLFCDVPTAFELSEMSLRLNEKLGDRRHRGMVLFIRGHHVNHWREHYEKDTPFLEQAFAACLEVGDLACAGWAAWSLIWRALEKGDLLDEVLTLSEKYAAFARETHNDTVHETIRLHRQLVKSLKGLTREPASFDDDAWDEAACLALFARAAFGVGTALYHIMKQQAAVIYGLHAEALTYAARAAETLHKAMAEPFRTAHCFYHALALAALHPQAPAAKQQELAQALEEQASKLQLWADICPRNFLCRHALVSAEVARIEGRDADAIRLYEQAIRSARDNGFVHHEALAYEVASRFYRARGFDKFADTYLREARACYARWGADGKVRQIDRHHPRLCEPMPFALTTTFAARPEQLDLLSVTKASQTISGEIVLDKLARTLLAVVLEQGGAQRACLLLRRGSGFSLEAEAVLEDRQPVTTLLGPMPPGSSQRIPLSLVHYVQRTKERVLLSDAAADAGRFAGDDYLARVRPRSVLCMPVLRQAEAVGLLYLENNLAAGAFTAERLAALELLASQAAISLQNALLHADERAARTAAEAAERRAAFLAEASALLSESLDIAETFARLGRLCVRSIGDWCSIDIVEDREIRRLAGAHKDPAKESVFNDLRRRYPPRWGSGHPAAVVLRTGEPLLMPELPDEVLRPMCTDDEHLRLLRALGTESGLAVPLVARGQTLGALTLTSSEPGRRFGPADLELALELARRAATAIDNARLYSASQEALRVRSEFLTVASHELNTPLMSLMLVLQSLRRAAPSGRVLDPAVIDRLLDGASRQGVRLTKLVADLLDVSRIESGRLQLELSEVELGALVREVVERFEPDLARSRCTVTVQAGAEVVGRWDRFRIDRVVTNLVSNAIKFGAGKPIEVTVGLEHGLARVAVRDHGIGIDPDQLSRIFGRFERAVSARHYGGLGLGLYISRRIVEDHGGSIRCESQAGAGSTFTVELPCGGPPAHQKA